MPSVSRMLLSVVVCAATLTSRDAIPQPAATSEIPEPVIQSNHSLEITVLLAHPETGLLASGSADGTVKLWSTHDHRLLRTLTVSDTWVRSLAFDDSGARLAVGVGGGGAFVYDVNNGRQLLQIAVAQSAVTKLAFIDSGSSLYVQGGRDPQGWICTGDAPCIGNTWPGPYMRSAADVKGAPDLAGADNSRIVWRQEVAAGARPIDASGLRAIRFSPDDGLIAVGSNSGDVALWDVASGVVRNYETGAAGPTYNYASSLAFSRDGRWLSAIRGDQRERWNWKIDLSPPPLQPLRRNTSGSPRDDFVKFGKEVGGFKTPGAPTIWIDGQPDQFLTDFTVTARAAPLTVFGGRAIPGGKAFATARNTDTNSDSWTMATPGRANQVSALAVSDDGSLVAVAFPDQTIDILHGGNGALLRTLRADGLDRSVSVLAFSSDGSLAGGTFGGAILLWRKNSTQAISLPAQHGAVLALAFSRDGSVLASGGADTIVHRWDVAGARSLSALKGHSSAITALAWANQRGVLASGSEDGTMRIWSAADGALLVTAGALAPDVWLAISPEGFFDGTRLSWSAVPFRFASRPRALYRPEQFFSQFFQPGLLSDAVATGRPLLARLRERNDPRALMNVGALINSKPAELQVRSTPQDAEHVTLSVTVRDAGSGARDLRVFRNQSLVASRRGDLPLDPATKSFLMDVPIELAVGSNELSAYVFNRQDVRSDEATIRVPGPAKKSPGVAYVLAIGVNRYSNQEFNLKYAEPDAAMIAQALDASLAGAEYSDVAVATLLNERATRANILAALGKLAGVPTATTGLEALARARPQDAVVVYFAGHGGADANRYYLLAHDVAYAGPRAAMTDGHWAAVFRNAVSDHDLDLSLEKIDAGRTLLIIDACQSGAMLDSAEQRRGPLNSRGIAQIAYEKGAYVLAAAQSNNAALELQRLGHGVLTYVLVDQGIRARGGDQNGDGRLTVQEWFRFAAERVPAELTAGADGQGRPFRVGGTPLSVQRPRAYFRRGSVDDWVIARAQ